MILKSISVGPYGTNCYIVGSETTKRGMIIDPGADPRSILGLVDHLGLSIIWIVITHCHFDHVGALKSIKDATSAKVAIHKAEAEGAMQAIAQTIGGLIGGSLNRPAKADKFLKDGDVLDIDDLHFTVLHTPGHSPGGISLFGHGILFSGDTLFNSGIGRTDFPGCSHTDLIDSIHRKLMTLPDEVVVLPGHGPESTIGDERKLNPFL